MHGVSAFLHATPLPVVLAVAPNPGPLYPPPPAPPPAGLAGVVVPVDSRPRADGRLRPPRPDEHQRHEGRREPAAQPQLHQGPHHAHPGRAGGGARAATAATATASGRRRARSGGGVAGCAGSASDTGGGGGGGTGDGTGDGGCGGRRRSGAGERRRACGGGRGREGREGARRHRRPGAGVGGRVLPRVSDAAGGGRQGVPDLRGTDEAHAHVEPSEGSVLQRRDPLRERVRALAALFGRWWSGCLAPLGPCVFRFCFCFVFVFVNCSLLSWDRCVHTFVCVWENTSMSLVFDGGPFFRGGDTLRLGVLPSEYVGGGGMVEVCFWSGFW